MVDPYKLGSNFRLMIEDEDGVFQEVGSADIDGGDAIRDLTLISVDQHGREYRQAMVMVPAGHSMSAFAPTSWERWGRPRVKSAQLIDPIWPDREVKHVQMNTLDSLLLHEIRADMAAAQARDRRAGILPQLPDSIELCKHPINQPPELADNRKSRRANAAKQRRSRR